MNDFLDEIFDESMTFFAQIEKPPPISYF